MLNVQDKIYKRPSIEKLEYSKYSKKFLKILYKIIGMDQ